jgi:hypothetical protein
VVPLTLHRGLSARIRENQQIRKRSATAFCPFSEQQIEYRFSRSSVNACGVGEHPIDSKIATSKSR